MSELKIISASDLPVLSEAEIKAQRDKEKAEYRKMLRDLCPLTETRQKARRISKRNDSCDTCVYCDGESYICWYPHTDIYMEDLDIDPCYEGVLRYLVKEAEEAEEARQKERAEQIAEENAALVDAPACLQKAMQHDDKVILILAGYLLDWADKNKKPLKIELDAVRRLRESTQKAQPFFDYLLKNGGTP